MKKYGDKKITFAHSFSVESLLATLIKHDAGNRTHIATPIVEPTKPIINSMDGMSIPRLSEKTTINIVINLKRCSGI